MELSFVSSLYFPVGLVLTRRKNPYRHFFADGDHQMGEDQPRCC